MQSKTQSSPVMKIQPKSSPDDMIIVPPPKVQSQQLIIAPEDWVEKKEEKRTVPKKANSVSLNNNSEKKKRSDIRNQAKMMRNVSCKKWLSQIQERNEQYMTPQLQARFKQRAQEVRKRARKKKKAKQYVRANSISKKAWGQGNMRMAYESRAPKTRSLAVRSRDIVQAKTKSSHQMAQINNVYLSKSNYEESDSEDDEIDALMDNIDNDIVVESKENKEVEVSDNSMSVVLEQMRKEPKDETLVKEKYKLFEEFLKNVETSRKATFDFWKDCIEDFKDVASARKQIEKDLKNLDNENSMSIDFDQKNVWFVYSMTVQADKNNDDIKGMLKKITTKLDMLENLDDDCPFCLDPLEECNGDKENGVVTLNCCHKSCKDCWTNWQKLKGNSAFCPLCKHETFLEEVLLNQKRQ